MLLVRVRTEHRSELVIESSQLTYIIQLFKNNFNRASVRQNRSMALRNIYIKYHIII